MKKAFTQPASRHSSRDTGSTTDVSDGRSLERRLGAVDFVIDARPAVSSFDSIFGLSFAAEMERSSQLHAISKRPHRMGGKSKNARKNARKKKGK